MCVLGFGLSGGASGELANGVVFPNIAVTCSEAFGGKCM